jgi:hypothetical protein
MSRDHVTTTGILAAYLMLGGLVGVIYLVAQPKRTRR